MSATNSTTNYSLPIFIGTDKPAWLTDWNGAMNSIDTAIKGVSTSQEGTASSLSTLSTTVENLGTTVSGHTTSIQTLSNSVSTNTGSINTINSLIGNGTPTTTDQTIIGAINEINAQVGGTVEADDVTYDNTTSGLTATNVQSAIDEVKGLIPSSGTIEADDVTYDNTTSGLTATNVQSAIDEIAQSGTGAWTLAGTISGDTTSVNLPSGFNEVHVVIKPLSDAFRGVINAVATELSSTSATYRTGYAAISNDGGVMQVKISTSAVTDLSATINQSADATVTCDVYVR